MSMDILQPPDWPRPKGYANGIAASGRMVFVAGMVGWNAQGAFESDDLPAQVRHALLNAIAVLKEASAGPQHVVRMTWYLTDRQEYLAAQKEIGDVYREIMGRHFPAMTVVEVSGLLEPQARVEIELTAVIPQQ
jgi:enamine deaminase RidA (YjgF/YER057c/UK114 family)